MRPTPLQRFFAKIRILPSGCWEWTGAKSRGADRRWTAKGNTHVPYGNFWFSGKARRAHRWAFVHIAKQKVPRGYELDHVICDFSLCVNPFHLLAVLPFFNNRRHALRQWELRKSECNAPTCAPSEQNISPSTTTPLAPEPLSP